MTTENEMQGELPMLVGPGKKPLPDRPFRQGVNFKEGKLYLFTDDGVKVVRGWPQPAAWMKTTKRPWWVCCRVPELYLTNSTDLPPDGKGEVAEPSAPATPASQLWLPLRWSSRGCKYRPSHFSWWGHQASHYSWMRFRAMIPRPVRTAVAQYPERQWHMLQFCARVPRALEFIESNPFLAFCLASNWVFHKPRVRRPLRSARARILRRQKDILEWLGFPATESAARVTRKVLASACRVKDCLILRKALCAPETAKLLAHVPRIDSDVLSIATWRRLREHATPRLLMELATRPGYRTCREGGWPWEVYPNENVRATFVDTLRMLDDLRPHQRSTFRVTSTSQLKLMHDELSGEFNRRQAQSILALSFPPPPLSGVKSADFEIAPIETPAGLLEHASLQKNCVASHAHAVAGGHLYIYSIHTGSERCTLAISRSNRGRWRIFEIKATCNEPASPGTLDAVQTWLSQVQTNGVDEEDTMDTEELMPFPMPDLLPF